MQIKGVAQERVTVWLSLGLRTAPERPDLVDSFRLLEAKRRQWKIEPDLGALRGAYDAYVESRGLRSQPWKRLCALVMNTDETHTFNHYFFEGCRHMFQIVEDFLDRCSPVLRHVPCPGKWTWNHV